jgi:hypothetical protein
VKALFLFEILKAWREALPWVERVGGGGRGLFEVELWLFVYF